jgi:hypothetical protein
MDLFDYPDPTVPNSDRATTTIAPQALLMLNSELVSESSRRLALQIAGERLSDDSARIKRTFLKTVSRLPSESEIASLQALLEKLRISIGAEQPDSMNLNIQAWTLLCQTLLCSNEFAYIR